MSSGRAAGGSMANRASTGGPDGAVRQTVHTTAATIAATAAQASTTVRGGPPPPPPPPARRAPRRHGRAGEPHGQGRDAPAAVGGEPRIVAVDRACERRLHRPGALVAFRRIGIERPFDDLDELARQLG